MDRRIVMCKKVIFLVTCEREHYIKHELKKLINEIEWRVSLQFFTTIKTNTN